MKFGIITNEYFYEDHSPLQTNVLGIPERQNDFDIMSIATNEVSVVINEVSVAINKASVSIYEVSVAINA
jgi:hypothetical protein